MTRTAAASSRASSAFRWMAALGAGARYKRPASPPTALWSTPARHRCLDRRITTVDQQVASSNKARRVAGEEHSGLRQLFRLAEAFGQVFGAQRFVGDLKRVVAA